jgi:hypothetical protein
MHSARLTAPPSLRRLFIFLGFALAASGCRDSGTEPARAPLPKAGFARTSAALAAIGPGWRTDAAEPYACLATLAARGGPIPYLYRRVALHLPPGLEAPDGAVAALRYRALGADGSVAAVLNCVIPATGQARQAIARRFGIPLEPEVDGVIADPSGCVTDQVNGETNDCAIAGIVATPEPQPSDNPCDYDPDCYSGGDPSTGGATSGGGDTSGGSTGGTSGGSTSCSNCGPNAPTVSCGAEVVRGAAATCTVSNSGDLNVAGWSFDDGTNSIAGPAGTAEWSGPAVASGTVFVSLVDGTGLYASLTVKARGWTWAQNGVSEYRDGTGYACLNHTPTFNVGGTMPLTAAANGLNLEIGWSDCINGRRFIQPDSYETGDGFHVTTASSGPNQGLHYVVDATLYLRRESTYNSGMYANAPSVVISQTYVALAPACGSSTNWYRFSTCMGAAPDSFMAGVKAHEGRGTTGHNGHYSAAYDAISKVDNDPMKMLDEVVGLTSETLQQFSQDVRERFRRRAEPADIATKDVSDGGTIVTGNWSGTYWGWFDDHFASGNVSF